MDFNDKSRLDLRHKISFLIAEIFLFEIYLEIELKWFLNWAILEKFFIIKFSFNFGHYPQLPIHEETLLDLMISTEISTRLKHNFTKINNAILANKDYHKLHYFLNFVWDFQSNS